MTMKRRGKALLVVVGFGLLILGFVAVDRWSDKASQRTAVLEAQYREMTYAMVQGQAGERSPSHPMYQLYQDRKEALLKAGYLKVWEFPMRRGFESRKALPSFFYRFATNFPGAEVRVRGRPALPPVLEVCARSRDILQIKWFIIREDKGPAEKAE